MTVFVLKRYASPYKTRDGETILGYFTNKAELQQALREFKQVFGVYDSRGYDKAVARGAFLALYRYADLVTVEAFYANRRLVAIDEFTDADA